MLAAAFARSGERASHPDAAMTKSTRISNTPTTRDRSRSKTSTAKPTGRDEVIEAIIRATVELCVAGGPNEVSLRRVAERANVNYGLVHRHFGNKSAVVRAAMTRAYDGTYQAVKSSADLAEAIDHILVEGSGTLARVLAWGILQGQADDVIPAESLTLRRLGELAASEFGVGTADEALATRALVGTLVGALLGWRLFEPYLTRGLGLEHLSRAELYDLIRPTLERFSHPDAPPARGRTPTD
jgi:AcrR family transcriptional regulator